MYKIIGGDHKEYGPVTGDELRRWIAEGRLSSQSLVQLEGAGQWKPLASFTEFVDALRAQAGSAIAAGGAARSSSAAVWSAQILAQRPELRIGLCLARSWGLLRANFGLLFVGTALVWLLLFLCQFFIPLVGGIAAWLLSGVFYGGLYSIFLNRVRGQPAFVGQVFAGFGPKFAQLLLAGAISSLLSKIGFVFCIVPGLYLLVAWKFSVPLAADKGLEFWSAMELSRKMVTRVWLEVFGLLVAAFLPFLLVGLVVEVKISIDTMSIMQDLLGSSTPDPVRVFQTVLRIFRSSIPLILLSQLVLALNLPFALGALMYAYEDLFGARPASAA